MNNLFEISRDGTTRDPARRNRITDSSVALRALGWFGVAIALPFFIWVPLALVSPLPTMIDVFGVVGLRIPAAITIGGLLMAAIGFHKF